MSARHNNQTIFIGLAITAAALVAGYLVLSSNREAADGGGGKDTKPSNLPRSKSPVRSRTTKHAPGTTTPVASNTSGRGKDIGSSTTNTDKAIHAKIEELDKQGKKLFKEKKVRKDATSKCTAHKVVVFTLNSLFSTSTVF